MDAHNRRTRRFTKSYQSNFQSFADQDRRLVWLRTTITSNKEQTRRLSLGFSDDVWVFMNQRFLYLDMNMYGSPIMKTPAGRMSLENTSFDLPLKKGENEIWIAVANSFFGWGIVARLDSVEGITDLTPKALRE